MTDKRPDAAWILTGSTDFLLVAETSLGQGIKRDAVLFCFYHSMELSAKAIVRTVDPAYDVVGKWTGGHNLRLLYENGVRGELKHRIQENDVGEIVDAWVSEKIDYVMELNESHALRYLSPTDTEKPKDIEAFRILATLLRWLAADVVPSGKYAGTTHYKFSHDGFAPQIAEIVRLRSAE